MSYQEDFGHKLELTTPTNMDLPYYRFVGMSSGDKLELATTGHQVLGVTIPSIQDYKVNSDGSSIKRDKYFKGEFPSVLYEGTCYVETDDKDLKVGDRLMLDTDGKVKKQTPNTENTVNTYKSVMGVVGVVLDVRKVKNSLKLVKVHLKL